MAIVDATRLFQNIATHLIDVIEKYFHYNSTATQKCRFQLVSGAFAALRQIPI
jgi:hypothetical protein